MRVTESREVPHSARFFAWYLIVTFVALLLITVGLLVGCHGKPLPISGTAAHTDVAIGGLSVPAMPVSDHSLSTLKGNATNSTSPGGGAAAVSKTHAKGTLRGHHKKPKLT